MAAATTKGLILLDVNGVMCAKYDPREKELECLIINPHYAVVARPGIREFVDELSKTYTLGIYSSTKRHNIIKILKFIFGDGICNADGIPYFQFIADRSYTSLHPDFGVNPDIKPFDTIKKLENIWSSPVFNEHRKWGPDNTLIIDDDLSKVVTNPEQTYWVAEKYVV